jgi:hypothetical protein
MGLHGLEQGYLYLTFYGTLLLNCPHEAEWTPFQNPYFSENVVGSRIEPGTSGSVAINSNHRGVLLNNNFQFLKLSTMTVLQYVVAHSKMNGDNRPTTVTALCNRRNIADISDWERVFKSR